MENKELVDLSWMWHCSDNPDNIVNYSLILGDDNNSAKALNSAAALGFRLAMRKMEDLKLIQMGDIDRNPIIADQDTWNKLIVLNL